MSSNGSADQKDKASGGKGKPDNEHGNNFASVMVDQVPKAIHRGSYDLKDLKTALGVGAGRELDIIENGTIRSLSDAEKIAIKDGMEFVTRQPAGGAS
jgi:hypothetical protein